MTLWVYLIGVDIKTIGLDSGGGWCYNLGNMSWAKRFAEAGSMTAVVAGEVLAAGEVLHNWWLGVGLAMGTMGAFALIRLAQKPQVIEENRPLD